MRDPRPILLLTRPLDGSQRFAKAVEERFGTAIEVVIAPLQAMEWMDDRPITDDVRALIFTSQNGVLGWNRAYPKFEGVAYCVGPQTTALAARFGFDAIDCGGDARAVIDTVSAKNPAGTVIHVRGFHGSGDIADQLRGKGVICEERIVYRQAEAPPPPEFTMAFQSDRPVLAPLFSPRSAALFCEHLPDGATPWLAVISPNAAERVDLMLRRRMMVAEAPNAGAMLELVNEFLNGSGQVVTDVRHT